MRGLVIGALATVIGLAGCAHRHLEVDQEPPQGLGTTEIEILPPPEPETAPPRDVRKRPPPEAAPQTISQALPTYPARALEDRVACAAQLLYHIQTDGSATLVRLNWDPAPPPGHEEAFESAIRDAVATWEFVPAYQLRFKELPDGSPSFEKRLIPKARRAVIRFRVEAGQPIVE